MQFACQVLTLFQYRQGAQHLHLLKLCLALLRDIFHQENLSQAPAACLQKRLAGNMENTPADLEILRNVLRTDQRGKSLPPAVRTLDAARCRTNLPGSPGSASRPC